MIVDALHFSGVIELGKQGENLVTSITFECAEWIGELTGGVLSLVAQRPTETEGYPVPCTTTETTLTWDVNSTDLAYEGMGFAEIRYTIGERIAKSQTFLTRVKRGLTPNETPPEAYVPYINAVEEAAKGNSAIFSLDMDRGYIAKTDALELVNALLEGKDVVVYAITEQTSNICNGDVSSEVHFETFDSHNPSRPDYRHTIWVRFKDYDVRIPIGTSGQTVNLEVIPREERVEIDADWDEATGRYELDTTVEDMRRYIQNRTAITISATVPVGDYQASLVLACQANTIMIHDLGNIFIVFYMAANENDAGKAEPYIVKIYVQDDTVYGELELAKDLPSVTAEDVGRFACVNGSGFWSTSFPLTYETFTFELEGGDMVDKTFLIVQNDND